MPVDQDEAQWLSSAAAVLRKSGKLSADDPDAAVWERLATSTIEGLTVTPLGTRARTAALPASGAPGQPPFLRGAEVRAQGWDIRSVLADPDPVSAAATAQDDLNGGASSLWIRVGAGGTDPDDLPKVLDGVYLDLAPVVLSAVGSELAAGRALAAVAPSVRLHAATNLGADPIGSALSRGTEPALTELPDITALATDLGVLAIAVDATVAHDRGAGEVSELAYAVAVGVGYLRELEAAGLTVDQALRTMEFRFAATDDQFLTIAKFRAARLLWDRVAEASGAGTDRPGQRQHAVTSWPMMTRHDSWTNLLRTTVAAFAAGVAGADALTVLPFDTALGIPAPLGRRLARNISHLLISESHVAESTDPAGGAYAVEELTWELAEAAWAEFGRIEQAGGVVAAWADGSLPADWTRTAAARDRLIATRRRPITGVSEFPEPTTPLPVRRSAGIARTRRWSADFEALRDLPAAGPVFLATLGPVPAHNARATFAANLFTAGGLEFSAAGATATPADVVAAYGGQPAVCLVGTDASYRDWGPALVADLRAAGARWIALAGRPAAELQDLVDDHFALGEDALAFLSRARHACAGRPSTATPSTASPTTAAPTTATSSSAQVHQ